MVRVNLGIRPQDLTDEHLRAENVELQMLIKFLNKYPDGAITQKFTLGKGHMRFFRCKMDTVEYRLEIVQFDMKSRKMNINKKYGNGIFKLNNIYNATDEDKKIVALRIIDRCLHPLKKKTPFHYRGESINDINKFITKYDRYIK